MTVWPPPAGDPPTPAGPENEKVARVLAVVIFAALAGLVVALAFVVAVAAIRWLL